jgi:thiol-disulfide isomerase/thioredoxin
MFRLLIILPLFVLSCTPKRDVVGTWRAEVEMQEQQLPFTFDILQDSGRYRAIIRNADEELVLDEVSLQGDTLVMQLHIFDAQIRANVSDGKMKGWFIKNYALNATLPFSATLGDTHRFAKTGNAATDFTGTYEVVFTTETDTTQAVGIFSQKQNEVTGTFLTPTGDYRYLQGNVVNDELMLSAFDGNHAFLFRATQKGDSLTGDFYSGKTAHEKWTAVKNENASLPDAESLTYLKPGFDKIAFSFPDVDKKPVTLTDEKFINKVVILQLFGTWCPNCMDETRFLTEWYNQNSQRGVEIIGLAYERKDDFTYASERVKKMKAKLNVPYEFVIAGVNDKVKAAETLPMLNKVVAFPTTIFIGKDGKVKHIHTGFSGPGTGIYFEQFKERFNELVNELLIEGSASLK